MTLESGPARVDKLYWLVVSIFCLVYSGWFVYDGAKRWPDKNRVEATKALKPLIGREPTAEELGESPTKEQFDALQAKSSLTVSELRESFGEPIHRTVESSGRAIEYYVSLYGRATVMVANNQVDMAKMRWDPWKKTKAEIEAQYKWALIPLAIGLYTLYRFYRAATLRAVIDDEQMVYGGKTIRFEAMNALRDYNPKGWIDLYYRAGEQERKLRIDNQKIAKFDEIVALLCEAKGFENPITAVSEDAGEADAAEPAAEPPPGDAGASAEQPTDDDPEERS